MVLERGAACVGDRNPGSCPLTTRCGPFDGHELCSGEHREMPIQVAVGETDGIAQCRELGHFDATEERQDRESVSLVDDFVELTRRRRQRGLHVDRSIEATATSAHTQESVPTTRNEMSETVSELEAMIATPAPRCASATIPMSRLRYISAKTSRPTPTTSSGPPVVPPMTPTSTPTATIASVVPNDSTAIGRGGWTGRR